MSTKTIAVIGAGGQAREIAWLVEEINRAQEQFRLLGFIVSDLGRLGERDSRERVLGDYDWLRKNRIDALAIGIGTPATRLAVACELASTFPDIDWPVLVHPRAHFDRGSCSMGRGVQICAGVVGTVNIHIAEWAMLNVGCAIGHEAHIGRGSVVNPNATLGGGVHLGAGVLIGSGANVLQYARIGDGASIGAGAVVTKDVSANATVVGVPARPQDA